MITIFNRKEVCITYDMKQQAKVRNILQSNGIKYTFKVTDRYGSNPSGSALRTKRDESCEYKIYVHKDDYEEAMYLIGK
ncbi:MAG: hypothetical protein IJE27_07495 [Anaerotignum sp.]|nr:hypothetical protein [Anaerotignum sp.]